MIAFVESENGRMCTYLFNQMEMANGNGEWELEFNHPENCILICFNGGK